ncbi:hypothetical protein [Rubritalea tangerina]
MFKIPTDWIIVSVVAVLGIACLVASHKMNEEIVHNTKAAVQEVSH